MKGKENHTIEGQSVEHPESSKPMEDPCKVKQTCSGEAITQGKTDNANVEEIQLPVLRTATLTDATATKLAAHSNAAEEPDFKQEQEKRNVSHSQQFDWLLFFTLVFAVVLGLYPFLDGGWILIGLASAVIARDGFMGIVRLLRNQTPLAAVVGLFLICSSLRVLCTGS